MTKKSAQLLRSNSYINLICPYILNADKVKAAVSKRRMAHSMHHHLSGRLTKTSSGVGSCSAAGASAHGLHAFNYNVNPLWYHGAKSYFDLPHHHHAHAYPHGHMHPHSHSHSHLHQHVHQHLHQHVHQHQHPHHHIHHLHQHQHQHQHQHSHSHNHTHTHTHSHSNTHRRDKLLRKYDDNAAVDHPQQSINMTIMQRSLPVFEVLPEIDARLSKAEKLFYQKSLLSIDPYFGELAMHRINAGEAKEPRLHRCVDIVDLRPKLPSSDYDIIFGNGKVVLSKPHQYCEGWETSRIGWLLELEHRQEVHWQMWQCNPCVKVGPVHKEEDTNVGCFSFFCRR